MGRNTEWTEDDSKLLEYLILNTKWTHKEIATEMEKSTATISLYKSKLNLNKFSNNRNYTKEEVAKLLVNRGYCSRDTWDKENHGIKAGVVDKFFGSWTKAMSELGLARREYTDEELLNILRNADNTSKKLWALNRDPNTPSTCMYDKRFGSWGNALVLAGRKYDKGTISCKSTILYLVEFTQEGVYKLGITQRTIKERLEGFPPYTIILSLDFEEYKDAKAMETYWLETINEFKITDNSFLKERNLAGHTECFIYV